MCMPYRKKRQGQPSV